MVKFTKDEVYDAAAEALCCGDIGGYGRYVRLRDAVRKDAEITGNFENYQRFVAYSNMAIIAYLEAYKELFTNIGFSGVLEDEEDYYNYAKHLQKCLLHEWTADKALDDNTLKEIIDDQI